MLDRARRVLSQPLGKAEESQVEPGFPDTQGVPPPWPDQPRRQSPGPAARGAAPRACPHRQPEEGGRTAPGAAGRRLSNPPPSLAPGWPWPEGGGPALAPRLASVGRPQRASGWRGCQAGRGPAPAPGCRPAGLCCCWGCGASGGAPSLAPWEQAAAAAAR